MELCNGVDREKVIAGLECCQKSQCNKCPYYCASDCTADLASDTLALLKDRAAQDIISALTTIRNELWEDAKRYLIKHTSIEKPILTGDECYIYKAKTERVIQMGKIVEIVKDYYKSEINSHSEESDDNAGKDRSGQDPYHVIIP